MRSMFAAILPRRLMRNRRPLHLLRAIEPREQRYWTIRCEVDYWRPYRDIYGEAAAAEALRRIAYALALTRRGDDRVVSQDGNQFMMILAGDGLDRVKADADRHREAVESLQIPHQGSPFGVVTISIGLATIVAGGRNATAEAIEAADAALGRAQRSGRNQVVAAAGLVPA
ncbi:MAG: diguanylate cyclase response regulator [Alphaproteobacteria bacterium]|nr:diguanylate cyclase response regulator [Alphaproteobacteria bacterium]